jgi:Fungal protein kinase
MSDNSTYITVGEPLFDFRADVAEGRATRVWKVHHKDTPDVFLVLKDFWMFSDTNPEGDILRDLYQKVEQEHHKYFLTVAADGIVSVRDGCPDMTQGTILRAIPKIVSRYTIHQPREYADSLPTMTGSRRNRSYGHTPRDLGVLYDDNLCYAEFSLRTHYRIVFNEVCQPLHDIRDLQTVFSLLGQATRGEY